MENLLKKFESLLFSKEFDQANKMLKNLDEKEEIFLENHPNRKKEGVYYTSQNLSGFIFRKTLILFLNSQIDLNLTDLDEIYTQKTEKLSQIREILIKITVCDPTCGSGNFLINAAKILYSIIIRINQNADQKRIKTQILKNLYGFDINQQSLELAKLKLLSWYYNGEFENYSSIISILNSNLEKRNSLLNSSLSGFQLVSMGFDIIIGNPPYGNILSEKEKKILKRENIHFNEIYCAYLLKALNICRGVIGFLIPKSFLLRQSYIKFRTQLLSEANFLRIFDLGSNIFSKATNEVQILIYEKKKNDIRDLTIYDFPDKEIITYQNQSFDTLRICQDKTCPLIDRVKKFYVYCHEYDCPYCSHPTSPLNRIRIKGDKEVLRLIEKIERIGNLNYLNVSDFPLFIRGEEARGLSLIRKVLKSSNDGSCYFLDAKRDSGFFWFKKSETFDLHDIPAAQLKGNHKEFYKGPKLLIKHNNTYPEAIYTEQDVCFTSSIYSLLHKDPNELKFLCALLNSVLIHFYTIFGLNNQRDTTINLNQYMIRHLPILRIDEKKKLEISSLVDIISSNLEKNKMLNGETIRYIKKLNDNVFQLYSINDKERAIMIKKVKLNNTYMQLIYTEKEYNEVF
jgi:hypothetical protein